MFVDFVVRVFVGRGVFFGCVIGDDFWGYRNALGSDREVSGSRGICFVDLSVFFYSFFKVWVFFDYLY